MSTFKEHIASVASISRYDAQGEERTGASYRNQLHKSQNVVYDFSVNGGAISDISLALPYPIPANALVYSSTMYATTDVDSAADALTAELGVVVAGDLSAAAVTQAQLNAGWREPRNSAVAPVVTTAETSSILLTIAAAAATAGVVSINIEYLLLSDA